MMTDNNKKRPRGRPRIHRKDSAGAELHGDAELNGVEIKIFAQDQNLSEAEVWNRVRRGELIARSSAGKVYIHPLSPTSQLDHTMNISMPSTDHLPPLPSADSLGNSSALTHDVHTPEIALLLDHLSLSKEENKEILKLTQESIARITQMSDTIVSMKDELIKLKDEQMENMRDKMKTQEQQLGRLRQEVEDLKMLTQTLSQENATPITEI